MTRLIDDAERNDDGDLIYEKTVPGPAGTTIDIEINATSLFTPGERRTNDTMILLTEARAVAEADTPADAVGNPAKPANDTTAKQAIERIEAEGLEPAWRVVDRRPFP